jgi:hypothetical protein
MTSAKWWIGFLLLLIPFSACQTTDSGSQRRKSSSAGASCNFDVNDVSVLFPLPTQAQSASLLLGLDAAGKGGVLLSSAHYDQMVTARQIQLAYADWRVVSFRFDTCGLDSAQPGRCLPQLRLEVQPLFPFNQARDEALHLIYNLDSGQLDNVLSDLRTLKMTSPATTSGAALGIHPGLAAAGLDSDYARSVEAFVLKYVGEPNLVRVAALLTRQEIALQDTWIFAASSVDATGTLTPLTIPGVAATSMTLTATRDPSQPPQFPGGIPKPGAPLAVLTPAPSGTDHLDLLLSVSAMQNAADADLQSAVDVALRLEHPTAHNPFDVDCASCHMASRQLAIAETVRGFNTDGNPNKFVIPPGVTGTFTTNEVPGDPLTVRYFTKAFAYADGSPSFIERTVNESAAIAALLNSTN